MRPHVLIGIAIVLGAVALLSQRLVARPRGDHHVLVALRLPAAPSLQRLAPTPSADAGLRRAGQGRVAGGLLYVPRTFASQDGSCDLVVHFHGMSPLVEESVALAGVNAVLVTYNLGLSSAPYEKWFARGVAWDELQDGVERALADRGLRDARIRRTALSAWSAGYGAVLRILEHPENAREVDAVLLLDGIHAGYVPETRRVDVTRIAPLVRFSEEAVRGRKLMVITHSQIRPPDYAGTSETTDALLAELGLRRSPGGAEPPLPRFDESARRPASFDPLKPLSELRAGDLHVRGFAGTRARNHTAHLIEMATLALPELALRWRLDAP